MDLLLNFGLAWVAVILAILLIVIYFLRKWISKKDKYKEKLQKWNRILRKHHKAFGIALIITGFVHGYFSSEDILSFNYGTIVWVLSILLGLNYVFRKYFKDIKGWMFYHRLLTIGFAAILLLHIYDVGIQAPSLLYDAVAKRGIFAPSEQSDSSYDDSTEAAGNNSSDPASTDSTDTTDNNEDSATADSNDTAAGSSNSSDNADTGSVMPSVSDLNKQMADVELKDGTYEGTATGYHDGLTVSVVIKDNAVVSIDIVSHNEQNPRFYQRAMDQVPQEIIDNQSLEVDTVSGATFTSVGIINAVRDALSQALVSGTLPADLALPEKRGHR